MATKNNYEKRIIELEHQVENLLKCLAQSNDATKKLAHATLTVVRRNPGREEITDVIEMVS